MNIGIDVFPIDETISLSNSPALRRWLNMVPSSVEVVP